MIVSRYSVLDFTQVQGLEQRQGAFEGVRVAADHDAQGADRAHQRAVEARDAKHREIEHRMWAAPGGGR